MDPNRSFGRNLLGLVAPAFFVALALMLLQYVDENPARTARMTRGLFGPTAWPTMMLYGCALFAAGWFVQDLLMLLWKFKPFSRKGLRPPASGPSAARGKPGSGLVGELRIGIGLIMIAGYGYMIANIGFAFATLLFIALWCVLGGLYRARLIIPVSLIGTTALLFLFVKLASMPLSRGQGVFADWTIALYRAIGIF